MTFYFTYTLKPRRFHIALNRLSTWISAPVSKSFVKNRGGVSGLIWYPYRNLAYHTTMLINSSVPWWRLWWRIWQHNIASLGGPSRQAPWQQRINAWWMRGRCDEMTRRSLWRQNSMPCTSLLPRSHQYQYAATNRQRAALKTAVHCYGYWRDPWHTLSLFFERSSICGLLVHHREACTFMDRSGSARAF